MRRGSLIATGMLLVCCSVAFALNPTLDVSQYAHTAWTVRDGFGKDFFLSIAQTPDGYLWLGTDSGLLRFDGVRAVSWQPPDGQQLPGIDIPTLLVTRDGALWIGTGNGLARWKDGKLITWAELSGQRISSLLQDREGAVLIGSRAGTTAGKLCAFQNERLLRFQTVSYLLPARPAEAKDRLDGAIQHAAQAITEGRNAVQGLRASTVERNDLAVAVRTLGDELATHPSAGQPPTFSVAVEGQTRDLHPIVRDEIYKIAAEALRNAFRHAQAGRVEVEIRYDNAEFRLRVRDDGKGINAAVLANQGLEGHYGLRGMPERAALIGGKLAVWSEGGAGTEVELRLPARIVYATSPRRSWRSRLLAPKTPANERGDAP